MYKNFSSIQSLRYFIDGSRHRISINAIDNKRIKIPIPLGNLYEQ